MLCLRLDVDTVGDCVALPEVISTLDRYKAEATFFVTTGFDRAGLNLATYLLSPWKALGKRVWKRYGIGNLLLSAIHPLRVELSVDFQGIRRGGHEVSLHGYEHTLWIRDFRKMGKEDFEIWIKKGWEAFETVAGFAPSGFASPGFTCSDELYLAIENFDFKYSSDSFGERPFYPAVGGKRLRTLQIPVAVDIENSVERAGMERYLQDLERSMGDVVVAYMHPSYFNINPLVLEKTLEKAEGSFATFEEMAEDK